MMMMMMMMMKTLISCFFALFLCFQVTQLIDCIDDILYQLLQIACSVIYTNKNQAPIATTGTASLGGSLVLEGNSLTHTLMTHTSLVMLAAQMSLS